MTEIQLINIILRIVTCCLETFPYLVKSVCVCVCVLKDGRDLETHSQQAINTIKEKVTKMNADNLSM
jgi:hypothetical protein